MTRSKAQQSAAIALFAVVGLFASACGPAAVEAEEATAAAPAAAAATDASDVEEAPEASLLSGQYAIVGGETIDLAQYEGQDVVMWFWAPW